MLWSSNLPDLNAIERMWFWMKKETIVGPIQTRQKKKKTTTTLIDINRIN